MSIFREYDIRGIADTDLKNDFCWALGQCIAQKCKKLGEKNIYIGQDVRLSSPRVSNWLCQGLKDAGMNIKMLHPGPTPYLYFQAYNAEESFPTKSGVMVTGSHNPAEFNGFKMVIADTTVYGDEIKTELKDLVSSKISQFPYEKNSKNPDNFPEHDLTNRYLDYITNSTKINRKLKVVLDAGNGAGGIMGKKLYEDMGCEVIPLFCDPDGTFPNHHPDPTVPKNLKDIIVKVKETGADLGIAYDGDADRIGAVSSTGQILFGDHLILYYARDLLKEHPGTTIISEVKSSQLLYDKLEEWGAKPLMWKTGHSLIKAQMKKTGSLLAGEMSGHMFFKHRYFGFDDALYAGARLLESLSQKEESLDDFLALFPETINTPELRVDCPDEKKFDIVSKFTQIAKKKYGDKVNDIDGARVKIHNGWGLLRASNTQPVLVMRFEADSQEHLKDVVIEFETILKEIDPSIHIPV